jgi:hypothetical protein
LSAGEIHTRVQRLLAQIAVAPAGGSLARRPRGHRAARQRPIGASVRFGGIVDVGVPDWMLRKTFRYWWRGVVEDLRDGWLRGAAASTALRNRAAASAAGESPLLARLRERFFGADQGFAVAPITLS